MPCKEEKTQTLDPECTCVCSLYKKKCLQLIVVHGLVVLTTWTTGRAVELAGDGVGDVGQLLLLLLEVLGLRGGGVLLEPVAGLLDGVQNLLRLLAVCAAQCVQGS